MSRWQKPVYDPTYVYRPWLKFVIIGAVLLCVLSILFYGMRDTALSPIANTAPATSAESHAPQETQNHTFYPVEKVVDGDTLDVLVNGASVRIRLIGVDTPETVDSRKTVQCFGKEASEKASSLLSSKSIRLEYDASQGERDKYNRLLAYVFLEDGTNVNQHMIAEGYAHEHTYNVPYKYQDSFKRAEESARTSNKGLWSPTTCNGDTTQSAPFPSASEATHSVTPQNNQSSSCDTNYTPCIPNVTYDLDCADIGVQVTVIGSDRHKFDRDKDGYGCESYG